MVKIALFAEGHTDQLVLKNVLLGGSQFDEEPEVHFVQPLAPGAGATRTPSRTKTSRGRS